MIAVTDRPGGWDFPLFLHVGGAMLLFGGVLAAGVLAWQGGRGESRLLARSTLLALVASAIPSWVVFRVGAEWISSREHWSSAPGGDPTWLSLGFAISDGGALLLLVLTGLAFRWTRVGGTRLPRWIAGLVALDLAALCVAWLAMSGKWS